MSALLQGQSLCSHRHICLHSRRLQWPCARTAGTACCRRRGLKVNAVGWDPEGILSQPKGGHIQRRTMTKQIAEDQQLADQVEKERLKAREELHKKREARKTPGSHAQLIDYFMTTEQEEMSFEVSRCRPLITDDFFKFLTDQISEQRFASNSSEDRIAELEGLEQYLKEGITAVDAAAKDMAAPAERMRALLSAPDKKAALLDLAGDNQIDKPLLDLLQQNIDAARSAGQEQPAMFMEKIKAAAQRYRLNA
ncbi:hypothetical protein WJX84_012386 [Apatococcus fuscideae]|uniref:Uncharacterized protein n=1 Tax=Apatococcus fuscideae TaxID=2026836 RepID=A0AAW1SKS0_9CHLO